ADGRLDGHSTAFVESGKACHGHEPATLSVRGSVSPCHRCVPIVQVTLVASANWRGCSAPGRPRALARALSTPTQPDLSIILIRTGRRPQAIAARFRWPSDTRRVCHLALLHGTQNRPEGLRGSEQPAGPPRRRLRRRTERS